MKKLLIANLKHVGATLSLALLVLIAAAYWFEADIAYGDNRLSTKMDREGPHAFFGANGAMSVETIRGNRKLGFYTERQAYPAGTQAAASVYFPLEDTRFTVTLDPTFKTPPARYDDDAPILAVSDVESGYKGFRDFLIIQGVIDRSLRWTFGRGHLVLVGDFVDRGYSTTQVLWFIYKLEQEAKTAGGHVHFILGNHEIKNLQGNFQRAAFKYYYVAALLDRQESELYGPGSFLGRWMASKNTVEMIGGYLFVHGGIAPKVAALGLTVEEINNYVRARYRHADYPRRGAAPADILTSTTEGPSWYRGYFKHAISRTAVEKGLKTFGARAVIVGHTPVHHVSSRYGGLVFATDVRHPFDYRDSFPPRHSEGLLIDRRGIYRLTEDGGKKMLAPIGH